MVFTLDAALSGTADSAEVDAAAWSIFQLAEEFAEQLADTARDEIDQVAALAASASSAAGRGLLPLPQCPIPSLTLAVDEITAGNQLATLLDTAAEVLDQQGRRAQDPSIVHDRYVAADRARESATALRNALPETINGV